MGSYRACLVLIIRFQVPEEPGQRQDHHKGGCIGGNLEIKLNAGVDQQGRNTHHGGKRDAAHEGTVTLAQRQNSIPQADSDNAANKDDAEDPVLGEKLEVVVVGVVIEQVADVGAPVAREHAVVTPAPSAEHRVVPL